MTRNHGKLKDGADIEEILTSVGFLPQKEADISILELHAIEPPL